MIGRDAGAGGFWAPSAGLARTLRGLRPRPLHDGSPCIESRKCRLSRPYVPRRTTRGGELSGGAARTNEAGGILVRTARVAQRLDAPRCKRAAFDQQGWADQHHPLTTPRANGRTRVGVSTVVRGGDSHDSPSPAQPGRVRSERASWSDRRSVVVLRTRSPTMSQSFDPERDGDEHRCRFERPAREYLVLVGRSVATW